jgi:hypothetical protein
MATKVKQRINTILLQKRGRTMARTKKESHPVTIRMEQDLYERLKQFCEDSGQPKTVAIERALKAYIDSYEEKDKGK